MSKAEQHVFFPIIHSYAGCGEGGLCLSGTCCEHRSRSCAASLVMKLMSEASVFPCAQISHRVINHIPSSPFPQTAHSYGQWLLCAPPLSYWILVISYAGLHLSFFPFSLLILHEVQRSCLFFCGWKGSNAVPQTCMALMGCVQRTCKELLSFSLHHPVSAGERMVHAWENHAGTWASSTMHTTDLTLALHLLLPGDLPGVK